MNNKFYANRYLATIDILKKHGLWDLELGMLFMPIIQHCMPAPSIHKIHQLLTDLTICKIDTDWAPYDVLLKLRKEVSRHTYAPDLSTEDEQKNWGTDYAIAYGVHRISQQTYQRGKDKIAWPITVRVQVMTEFVETIYENLGSESIITKSSLYMDIYQLRDVLIVRYANENKIGIFGNSRINIQGKEERILEITHLRRSIGNPNIFNDTTSSFWENPPETQFCIQLDDISPKNPTKRQKYSDSEEPTQTEYSDEEYMKNNIQQRLNLFSERPRWLRNNVRSLADGSQLSWGSIFKYWEFILTQERSKIFELSLVSLLTGIPKKRWINGQSSNLLTLDSVHLEEDNEILLYKLNGGATDFFDGFEERNVMRLALPVGLNLTNSTIKAGLKEEGAVRAYSRRYSGPSPTLNNITRSGHTLLRKKFKGETLAFIMAGRMPIEFKARSAYLATDSDTIHKLFNSCFTNLKKEVVKRAKQYPRVNQALKNTKERKTSSNFHLIGSQLATQNWDFSTFKPHSIERKTIEDHIECTNQLVLYFYWMIQYSLATRPTGEKTESSHIGNFWLHKDKNSDRYFESKILLIPKLLKEQMQEIHACVSNMQSFAKKEGYKIDEFDFDPHHLCFYKVTKKIIKAEQLLSSDAIKLTKKFWALTLELDRANAYRHQCASYIHKQLGENHADIWLGHHIDGWSYSAPESSANHKMLNDVLQTQELWLEEMGFHLIKNPLS